MNSTAITSDDRIIDYYLIRNEEAISLTKSKYGSRILHMAMRFLQDEQAANECENDVYLSTWNLIPPNEPRTYFFAFLSRITRHHSIDMVRNQKASKRSAEIVALSDELSQILPDKHAGIEDDILVKELMGLINTYLLSQTKEKQLLFARRYFYADSLKDAAALLGISESKAKTILFRMRKELKTYLNKEGYII